MSNKEVEQFCPKSPLEWRQWLEENHASATHIWLVYFKASTKVPSLSWSEAVDEALCFGWIDSTKKTIDQDRYMQYFSPRKAKSMWSRVNKEKVVQLIKEKRMRRAGLGSIAVAKENGAWSQMDDVENLVVPEDLEEALSQYDGALEFFKSQSKSTRKLLLHWVVTAKRPETRKKRIGELAENAAQGRKPKQFV